MEALYLLIPMSVVLMFGAAWVFLKASDSGQFDDLEGPAWSVLHDDDRASNACDRASNACDRPSPSAGDPRSKN